MFLRSSDDQTYGQQAEADAAIQQMNEQELDGRRVRVGHLLRDSLSPLTTRSTWPTLSPLVVVTVDPATTLVTEVAVVATEVVVVVTVVARAVVSKHLSCQCFD